MDFQAQSIDKDEESRKGSQSIEVSDTTASLDTEPVTYRLYKRRFLGLFGMASSPF
jgi:hypothetical protein